MPIRLPFFRTPSPLFIFCLCGLASALANRAMDPLVTAIAADYKVSIAAAAGVVSIYALPYAFGQPILGPIGDYYGKARVLRICLWVQCVSMAFVVFSPFFFILLAARFLGGIAGGGVMPIAMASVGDLYPAAERQQAIARYVSVALTGMTFSAALAGILAVYVDWRAIWVIALAISLVAAVLVTFFIETPPMPERPMRLSDGISGYRMVFGNPRALICYTTVMLEGIALYGVLPYIGPVLQTRGDGGPWEAGLIITGFAFGALAFTSTVHFWLKFASRYKLMFIGGFFSAAGPAFFAFDAHWLWSLLFFGFSGIGYMLVHNSVQAEVAALAPEYRGSAFAMHSCSFFIGQSLGPLIFGAGQAAMGASAMLFIYAAILLVVGPVVSLLFSRAKPSSDA